MTRSILDDARLAIRSFLKQPRFAIIAGATLALGIGLVTAIFSVVNGVLLKPLPNPEPGRLVNIWSNAPGLGYDQFPLSPDMYYFYRTEHRSFADMTMYTGRSVNLTGAGEPGVLQARTVTYTYFSTLGIAPAAGSTFGERDDSRARRWPCSSATGSGTQRFSGAASVVGQAVQIDGAPATIVGVMPAWVDEIESPDLFMPARLNCQDAAHGIVRLARVGAARSGRERRRRGSRVRAARPPRSSTSASRRRTTRPSSSTASTGRWCTR